MNVSEYEQNHRPVPIKSNIRKFTEADVKDLICNGYLKRMIEVSETITVEMHTLDSNEFNLATSGIPKDISVEEQDKLSHLPIVCMAIDRVFIKKEDGSIQELECDTSESKRFLREFIGRTHLFVEIIYTKYMGLLSDSFDAIKLIKKN